jgi:hypothetical protein
MSKTPPPRVAASQSFTEPEVAALDLIIKTILRDGGDLRVLRKSAAVINLARKVGSMRASIARQKLKRDTLGKSYGWTPTTASLAPSRPIATLADDAGDSDWDEDQDARDGLPDVGDK